MKRSCTKWAISHLCFLYTINTPPIKFTEESHSTSSESSWFHRIIGTFLACGCNNTLLSGSINNSLLTISGQKKNIFQTDNPNMLHTCFLHVHSLHWNPHTVLPLKLSVCMGTAMGIPELPDVPKGCLQWQTVSLPPFLVKTCIEGTTYSSFSRIFSAFS